MALFRVRTLRVAPSAASADFPDGAPLICDFQDQAFNFDLSARPRIVPELRPVMQSGSGTEKNVHYQLIFCSVLHPTEPGPSASAAMRKALLHANTIC